MRREGSVVAEEEEVQRGRKQSPLVWAYSLRH